MLKNFSKLLISAIVLLVILSITLGLLQMTTRSRIKRVIEDWEKALCEFRLDQALACCAEEGVLIRNGKMIPFSDPSAVYRAVGKRQHGTSTQIRYDTIDVVGEDAAVSAVFVPSQRRSEPVPYRFTLKRFGKEWKITKIDDGSEIIPADTENTVPPVPVGVVETTTPVKERNFEK